MTVSTTTARRLRLPDMTSSAFLIIAFLTGIAGALQTPTLSLFLTTEVKVSPFMVGLFFTGSAVMGIFVSQFLGGWSDKKGDRKTLILFCCLLGALGCVLFAFNRSYFILLLVGVLLTSFGSTANPQMFALAREHADKTGREAVMFSSILRAQVSLAWVVGPPLAFALALGFGFTFMYCAAAVAFILCGIMVRAFLPSMPKAMLTTAGPLEAPRNNRRDTLMLFIACSLMWAANSIYLINMPLYVVKELHLSSKLAGMLMGIAACLEIPTMLVAGYLARQLGKRLLMRFAVICGVLFYGSLMFFTGPATLIAIQLLNALFIGILAGIGMLYFQDLMPGQAGAATTLFTNSTRAGWILAGSLAGLVAQFASYYAVFYAALAMVVVSVFCIWRVREA
ncbi:sugar efflux transporter [Rouxiella badensis]|jgi:SET family sugar efflux transporter-like MFS transporter|uniref:MFS transporter n=2 Tax=Rouxiella badensis TaxID=1646377 RepID=A0A1X0WH98_9GAMM|nr:sugar efflux transporter [Rouxiella badensis]MCC3703214.1 sugar efflux transporter [Rouxiella badensis]MCC3735563.1 sugar efflux transporter [Rouxiella badensis]MCC3747821.1 sugar efflux transporter [Rouxiella badensis]MCC3760860.1 sugar efflux transporter [Rouxiella badensis]ORJ26178.1 MFS transporter [Rouxiella badensis]